MAWQSADRIEAMEKVWVCGRRDFRGWWCGWYENGKRKPESLPMQALGQFMLERRKQGKGSTLDRDINNLRVFLNWAAKKRYIADDLMVERVRVAQIPVAALSCAQVKRLLITTSTHPTIRLRILLAVTTRVWRGDIDTIRIGNVLHE